MNPLHKYSEVSDYKELWASARTCPAYVIALLSVLVIGYLISTNLPHFLLYKESIDGKVLWDPITSNFNPVDFNPYIFYITTVAIFVGMLSSMPTPRSLLHALYTFAFLNILRVITLYFINLDAPADIIPLYDPLLEKTFYNDVVITKDLFFSGHTSNIVVFAFLTQIKQLRIPIAITAFIVASMLVLQHVHYTIDVVAAPFIAYGVYMGIDVLISKLSKTVK